MTKCISVRSNETGEWFNVTKEIRRGRKLECQSCRKKGATIGCFIQVTTVDMEETLHSSERRDGSPHPHPAGMPCKLSLSMRFFDWTQ